MTTYVRGLGMLMVAFIVLTLMSGPALGQTATGEIRIVQGGVGEGRITSVPAGINCVLGGPDGPTGTCTAEFLAGTKVRLKAEAANGSKFLGWAPVNSCPKPKNLTIEAGRTHNCQPVFERTVPVEFLLQTGLDGSGRVVSEPAGIDCTQDAVTGALSGQCAAIFPRDAIITLTAVPADGWTFVSWSGEDADCADGIVTMDAAKRCIATFAPA